MLSDRTIRKMIKNGRLGLWVADPEEPIQDEQYQPASIDLRMGEETILAPLGFALAHTLEYVHLNQMTVGRVEGKSSWARRGLSVHCAGFIDPGFNGQITLELFNYTSKTIVVEKGKRIAQIALDMMDDMPERVYGDVALRSRYQNQAGATPAREWPLGSLGPVQE